MTGRFFDDDGGPDPDRPGPFDAPTHVVIQPDEGVSYWQPEPSRGFVEVLLTPSNMPYDTFSAGTQRLPPGCAVREHGHKRNHELIHITGGSGYVTIDETTYRLKAGSTILFGRYCRHLLVNDGEDDMTLFWVFFPPGLENWFHAIGRRRTPGEPMPEAFPRPENVRDIQDWMRFVPPKGVT